MQRIGGKVECLRTHHPASQRIKGEGEEVVPIRSIHEAVELAIPHQSSTNHRCLCKLAGALRAVEHNIGKHISSSDVREAFNQWYTRSLAFLNQKQSKDEYLLEFMDAWANIKNPLQRSAADVAWERAQKAATPPEAVAAGIFADLRDMKVLGDRNAQTYKSFLR